jgi:ubiquinone/menaquinone biosynthesis C-methylase UbiE
MTDRIDYDDRQWSVYERARGLSPERARLWSGVLGNYLDRSVQPTVLDLGCGTGAYSELLAEAFDASVTGVEPSQRMRAEAERLHPHPRVRYQDGSGERIPLPDESCDAALLSNVVHHLRDRHACAAELHRVLRASGLVLVRGSLRGRRVPFVDFFPTVRPLVEAEIPSQAEVEAMFAEGFDQVATEVVAQETSASFREYCERVSLRGVSMLERISDEEFEQGVARMREAADRETEPLPVIEEIDLLVFRRTD